MKSFRRHIAAGLAALAAAQHGIALAEPGVTADTITLGQSAAFTGAVSPQVKEMTAGALAYFSLVNQQGGVHGRRIVLASLDDGFEPKRAAENTRKLIEDKRVFCLFLYRATPTTEAAIPVFTAARVPLVGPSTGAQSLYTPVNRYLFPVRPSYHAEAAKIIDQLATMGLKRIAILHADDSFGQDGRAGYEKAMAARGLDPVTVVNYPRGTVKVDAAAAAVVAARPQAVVMVSAANAGAAFIRRVRKLGLQPQFVLLSNVSSQAFVKDLGDDGRGVGVSQIGPNPHIVSSALIKEFQVVMRDNNAERSYSSLEGYVAAKVMVEGLRRAGREPTREKLVAALEGLGNFDIGGLKVSYSPSERAGSNFVEVSVISKQGRFIH